MNFSSSAVFLKKHEFFKRVKYTGYNHSYYFSTNKGDGAHVESMIGLSGDELDPLIWRFSIFKDGLLLQTFHSNQGQLGETDEWFQTLIVDVAEKLNQK